MVTKISNNQNIIVKGYGILILVSGSITIENKEKNFILNTTKFGFVNSNFNIIAASPYFEGTFIDLNTDLFPNIYNSIKSINQFFNFLSIKNVDSKKRSLSTINNLNKENTRLLESYVHVLTNELIEDYISLLKKKTIFQEFENLIETNIEHNFCAGTYADMMNIPLKKLIKEVKVKTNKTPCNIITDKVISLAKEKLLSSDNTSQMIAYQLGFDDPYYFIKYFKKNTSYTPTQFRATFK